jgi:hypothetical protein
MTAHLAGRLLAMGGVGLGGLFTEIRTCAGATSRLNYLRFLDSYMTTSRLSPS